MGLGPYVNTIYSRFSLVRTRNTKFRLIRTLLFPFKASSILNARITRIPDRANKFQRSPDVRINKNILYLLSRGLKDS